MYEIVLEKRDNSGVFRPIFRAVKNNASIAKELAANFDLFPVYRDGSREVTYADLSGKFKLYVTRLDRWW